MSAPAFGRPLPVDSLLHRRDPTIKLAVVLVVCLVITAVVDPITPTALYLLTWPVALLAGRIPAATLLRAHVPFVAFAFSLLLVNATTRQGEPIARVLALDITAEGLSIGAGLAMRTLMIGIVSVTFVLTTDGARLMTSLHQHIRLSGRFAYAVLAGYRLLEQLPETWQTIRAAQAVRDPRRREQGRRQQGRGEQGRWKQSRPGREKLDGSVRRRHLAPSARPRSLAQAAFTLLVTSLRRGERMSIALETRGLGAGRRTIAAPSDLRAGDAVLAVIALGALALVLGISWRLGVLRGLGELGVFG